MVQTNNNGSAMWLVEYIQRYAGKTSWDTRIEVYIPYEFDKCKTKDVCIYRTDIMKEFTLPKWIDIA